MTHTNQTTVFHPYRDIKASGCLAVKPTRAASVTRTACSRCLLDLPPARSGASTHSSKGQSWTHAGKSSSRGASTCGAEKMCIELSVALTIEKRSDEGDHINIRTEGEALRPYHLHSHTLPHPFPTSHIIVSSRQLAAASRSNLFPQIGALLHILGCSSISSLRLTRPIAIHEFHRIIHTPAAYPA
ncbi:hypothetical protein K402DRAFT_189853 [Aulographum hederae CBS 113979]|uniref:Uncharacterized protein n=1 Tax=Aulographum hederae CBS 113979 TaxID=1176131 RepID=A0A6G1GPT9_9PEZI|nr:hypothetical protein K402DRAFT_189853 [Aulographum hederae CBS 113979]